MPSKNIARRSVATNQRVTVERKREVESGLMEWVLMHLTSRLIDEAFVLECVVGEQFERERMALALEGTNFARVIETLWERMEGEGYDKQDRLIAIFKSGFSVGIRTTDLAVVRRSA